MPIGILIRYAKKIEIIDRLNEIQIAPQILSCIGWPSIYDIPKSPLIVFIHGGYWQLLSKDDCLFPAKHFVDHGIAYCAIDYTLAPIAHISEMIEQCRRSIQWLFSNAKKFGYDKNKIFLLGSSAGAHLATMTMLTNWSKYNLPDDVIKGVTL